MNKELKERLNSWLAMSRDLLRKVMDQRDKADAAFHDDNLSPAQLKKACDEVEDSLDEVKDLLKRLYLTLYEVEDSLKAELGKEGTPPAPPPQTTPSPTQPAPPKPPTRAVTPETAKVPPPPHISSPLPPRPPVHQPATLEQKMPQSEQKIEVPEYKIPEKPSGLLEYLGQWHWFVGQPKEKRDEIVAIMCSDEKITPYDVLEREIKTLRPQFASYCWKVANKLMKRGYDEIATSLLIKGLTVVTQKRDKEMLHVMYAKYFYRQRKILKDAYAACINHCEKAIKSYMQDKEARPKPVAPFKLLTMIYEEQNNLSKIIDVCDKAISLYQGTPDESKVIGFIRIKDILEKKEKEIAEGKPHQFGKMVDGGVADEKDEQ